MSSSRSVSSCFWYRVEKDRCEQGALLLVRRLLQNIVLGSFFSIVAGGQREFPNEVPLVTSLEWFKSENSFSTSRGGEVIRPRRSRGAFVPSCRRFVRRMSRCGISSRLVVKNCHCIGAWLVRRVFFSFVGIEYVCDFGPRQSEYGGFYETLAQCSKRIHLRIIHFWEGMHVFLSQLVR